MKTCCRAGKISLILWKVQSMGNHHEKLCFDKNEVTYLWNAGHLLSFVVHSIVVSHGENITVDIKNTVNINSCVVL